MKRSLGTTLLLVGAGICVLGALGLTLGMFVTIPPAVARTLVRALGFSAPFLVGGALMVAGAAVLRATGRRGEMPPADAPAAPAALGEPAPGEGLPAAPRPAARAHSSPS